ncbi:MAG: hypothetical protein WC471_00075 [Candidatus Woesearchaeota archaeon]
MALFSWGKKKEELASSLPESLPPPPQIDTAELPPLMKERVSQKVRFPSLPDQNPIRTQRYEKKAYAQEKEFVEQRESLQVLQPLFIKGILYKEMIFDLDETKAQLKKAGLFTTRVDELTQLREESFEELKQLIETMQRKLIFMDKTLFK